MPTFKSTQVRRAPGRYKRVVVASDTASTVFDYDTFTVATWVDNTFLSTLNLMGKGYRSKRTSVANGERAIYLATSTSSLLSLAPTDVTSLISSLPAAHRQAYVFSATSGGDIWIVSASAEGIRHGCYDLLRRNGYRALLPHPDWQIIPQTYSGVRAVSASIVAPVWRLYEQSPNGGFGSTVNPTQFLSLLAPLQQYYRDWAAQNRNPREWHGGNGDGDEDFLLADQDNLQHDRSCMAWVASRSERGAVTSPSPELPSFPSAPFTSQGNLISKLCSTNRGPAGGTAPAPYTGPTPWNSIPAVVVPTVWSLSPDPGPDSAVDSNPTEISAFGGVLGRRAVHHLKQLASRIRTYGPFHPFAQYVSGESPDGNDDCQSNKCKNLLRLRSLSSADALPADLVAEQNNFLADYLLYAMPDAPAAVYNPKVAYLAYTNHATPPTIPIRSNINITVLPDATGIFNELGNTEFIEAWGSKKISDGFELSIQPSWVLPSGFDAPRLSAYDAFSLFQLWQNNGFDSFTSQNTSSAFTLGPHFYVIAELCWPGARDSLTILNEWFDLSFGPCSSQVRAIFERWWQWYEWTPNEIAMSFAGLAAAQTALNAAPDASIQKRLDSFKGYVNWQRVYVEYYQALKNYRVDPTLAKEATLFAAGEALQLWGWEIFGTTAIQAQRVTDYVHKDFVNGYSGLTGYTAGSFGPFVGYTGTATVNTIRAEITTGGKLGTVGGTLVNTGGGPVLSLTGTQTTPAFLDLRVECTNISVGTALGQWVFRVSYNGGSTWAHSGVTSAATYALDGVATGFTLNIATGNASLSSVWTYTTSVFRWSSDGGSTWTSNVSTAPTTVLAGTGITLTWTAGTYATTMVYSWSFLLMSRWDIPTNGAGFTDAFAGQPTTSSLNTMVTSTIAAYPGISGVTRKNYIGSLSPISSSVLTTQTYSCNHSLDDHNYVFQKPSGSFDIQLSLSALQTPAGSPMRVVVESLDQSTVYQTFTCQPPATGDIPNPHVYTLTISSGIAPGQYRLRVQQFPGAGCLSKVSFPLNVPFVWVDQQVVTRGFDLTTKIYFYVPTGETRIAMAFNAVVGQAIAFFDDTNTSRAVVSGGVNSYYADVPAGHDGKIWYFTGFFSTDQISAVRFENCPNVFGFSREQMMKPSDAP